MLSDQCPLWSPGRRASQTFREPPEEHVEGGGSVGRILQACILCTALLAAACQTTEAGPAPQAAARVSGSQTYTVGVDAPSTAAEQFVFGESFPATIKARPGDTSALQHRPPHDSH